MGPVMIDWPPIIFAVVAGFFVSIYLTYRLIRDKVLAVMRGMDRAVVDHMTAENYKKYLDMVYDYVRSDHEGTGRLTDNELTSIRVHAEEHAKRIDKEFGVKRTRNEVLREIMLTKGGWQVEYFQLCDL